MGADVFPKPMVVTPASRRLRIAVVYSRVPLPMRRADQLTVAHLLAFLKERGHIVDLYSINTGAKLNERQLAWLKDTCRSVRLDEQNLRSVSRGLAQVASRLLPFQVGLFHNYAQRAAVVEAAATYDVIYTYYVRSAEAARGLGRGCPGASAAGNRVPVSFLAYQLSQTLNTERISRNAPNLAYKLFYSVESRLMARYEARIWRHFTRSVLIGPRDLEVIEDCCRRHGARLIDNYVFGAHGTDIERYRPRPEVAIRPNHLVFSGVMRTPTNVQAVQWFVRKVWPDVRRQKPEATFAIVGREPIAEVMALAKIDGVQVTGTVPDPAEPIAQAAVCVNPMQAGGGMQNKLIEYLASSKPVVATSVANEGIRAKDGEHLLIADDPRDFARGIVGLLDDPERSSRLAAAGRRYVEENWTWEAHWLKLEKDFYDALDGKTPSREISPALALAKSPPMQVGR